MPNGLLVNMVTLLHNGGCHNFAWKLHYLFPKNVNNHNVRYRISEQAFGSHCADGYMYTEDFVTCAAATQAMRL